MVEGHGFQIHREVAIIFDAMRQMYQSSSSAFQTLLRPCSQWESFFIGRSQCLQIKYVCYSCEQIVFSKSDNSP